MSGVPVCSTCGTNCIASHIAASQMATPGATPLNGRPSFADLKVSPPRMALRNSVAFDALVRRLGADYRYPAILALGLEGEPPVPLDELETRARHGEFGLSFRAPAPWNDIDQAMALAEAMLAQDRPVATFRAGLEGKACLAALREEQAETHAQWRSEARQLLAAAELEDQMRYQRERMQVRRGIKLGALIVTGISLLIGVVFAALVIIAGESLSLLGATIGAMITYGWMFGFAAWHKLRGVRPVQAAQAEPAWIDKPEPSWLLADPEDSPAIGHSSGRQLRDRLRAITAAAYEGDTLADAHQALIEIRSALALLPGSIIEPELILPPVFADALLSCPCQTLSDLHPPRVRDDAPIGDAYGLTLSRDPKAQGLTLRWRAQPDEDPYVLVAPLPTGVRSQA
jgi:hypothetical protein